MPRFIPTYVGHTCGPIHPDTPASVHPHIRGAYYGLEMENSFVFGSSPHTWGIRRIQASSTSGVRFIPTYVGHTLSEPSPQSRFPVHPHIRGAYGERLLYALRRCGSSPHTWGIQTKAVQRNEIRLVHPHIRGAYRRVAAVVLVGDRFIPTYVGHTPPRSAGQSRLPVHPHIRGAYTGPP